MKMTSHRLNLAAVASALAVTVLVTAGPVFAQAASAKQPAPATAQTTDKTGTAPAVAGAIEPPAGYVIGAEDVLGVLFWREKDLSVDGAAVRPDGRITLPLLNDVAAAGLTPDQLRERIQTAASKFVEDPSVTVVVKTINSRKVYITGMIGKPGQYPLTGPTTVMQLIAMAGGLHEFADADKILIMRTEDGKQSGKRFNYEDVRNGKNLNQNIELQPGDTVVVP
jgi:polysaccharide export outer membrane protein